MIELRHLTKCLSIINLPSQLSLHGRLNFCTDTRRYQHPSAFVAIPGSKVNPLDVIDNLLNQRCPIVIYQANQENETKVKLLSEQHKTCAFIPVTDSVSFLQELSHEHIKHWKNSNSKNTVFAISGSNGKTTHKEMLSFILKSIKPNAIISTEKNNNNHLGVPLTLLQVTDKTEMVVLELGSNHPGEIKVLCNIARPNAGLTTNIGATHLEFFGTEENVFFEEGYLYYSIKDETNGMGFYLINMDDPFLQTLLPLAGSVTYGESIKAQAQVSFLENGAKICYQGKVLQVINDHITGRHNKLNLITCSFIAQHFYPEYEKEILQAASDFRPTKNRSEWINFENRMIFLDAYNANPSSMMAALEGFKESVVEKGLKLDQACIVLGDMNELGDTSAKYHQEVGSYLKKLGFRNVYFIGRFSTHYCEGYSGGETRVSVKDFKSEYRNSIIKNYQIHFIKGSRSLQLESLFDIT